VAALIMRMATENRSGDNAGFRANCSNSATASAPQRSAGSSSQA